MSDLGPALVTGGVAAVTIVAGAVNNWLNMRHRRWSAREQRTCDAVQELYVDLLMETRRYQKKMVHTIDAQDHASWPGDPDVTSRLKARDDAFTSDAVRSLDERRRSAYSAFGTSLVDDRQMAT